MGKLLSRKLVLGAMAIAGHVGIVVGVAVVDPTLLVEAKEIVALAMVNITAITGIGVIKQADIDKAAVVSSNRGVS